MSLTYKKTPSPRLTVVQNSDGMLGGKKPPPPDLPDEDNYEIQVWESKGGKFLGYALKTTLRLAVHTCWLEAIKLYPGKYLCQMNGPFEIRDIVAPAETPSGEIETDNEIRLNELPQWYGLRGQCTCGKKAVIDRYEPKVQKWKGYSLAHLASKLSCSACQDAGRGRGEIKIKPFKLPR